MNLSVAYQKWREETLQEGRQEGRQEGEVALILKQLTRRVGSVPDEMQAAVWALPLAKLEALGEALLDFASRADLDAWLESNRER